MMQKGGFGSSIIIRSEVKHLSVDGKLNVQIQHLASLNEQKRRPEQRVKSVIMF